MICLCPDCGRRYDDVGRWKICPHRVLDAAPDAPDAPYGTSVGYCTEHDLFNCQFDHDEERNLRNA